ncbi:GH39 family glycosyl hydrolase [Sphingobium yanoikuyae]|uniref:GH39 family glycosyl hydrolase n=2 Tax=Sphingobium yanoikuyae TaxID=13690 RepID=UPI00241F8BFC|nr:glycosyl hydrolase [Sphingobium yanoikuyae]
MNEDGLSRRAILGGGSIAALGAAVAPAVMAQDNLVPVRIDIRRKTGPLPHIWKACVGSDRAAITLRETWRNDLRRWTNEAGTQRVRFHGIFADEMAVMTPTILSRGKVTPNFQRVDQVYDGLLANNVKPFVELSFMPKGLAAGTTSFFFYGGIITPPKANDAWADFIKAFITHLVARYGLAEVRQWPFEVWNEPNLSVFWTGTKEQYFEFYRVTALAIKSIDSQIQVGGPSTASAEWIADFASYCATSNTPVDFFTTHVYAGDSQDKLFGKGTARSSQNDVIPRAIRQARGQIDASPFAGKPLWITEWSSDSPAMITHVIKESLPYCQAMSPWVMSCEYEELGIADYILKEGDSGWGMISAGIAKPSFNTYKLLNALGPERLEADGPVLASRREDGMIAALVWNLADVTQPSGIPGLSHSRSVRGEAKSLVVDIAGARPGQSVSVRYVDQERGSPMPAWREMGSPQYPSRQQIDTLRQRADIAPAQKMRLDRQGRLALTLPPEGVALLELQG